MLSLIFLVSLLPFISGTFSTSNDLDTASEPLKTINSVGTLHLSNGVVNPDGYEKTAILVNNQFPAPIIKAHKNDHFVLNVLNKLTDANTSVETSIHWHGISQHRSNWADGVASVTQCPIGQYNSFEYRFTARNQTGTYWYHSHYLTQYCDALRGPLIIYDPQDPLGHLYDVDDETTVITLADWYHLSSAYLGTRFSGVSSNATLINGRGRYPGGPLAPLSVINVKQGLRYRFRVLSTSCAPYFNFSIDDHKMTIIEADGQEVHPYDVSSFPIYAGQRYSVIVTANQSVGNYWMRAFPNVPGASYDDGQNMAILRYVGAPEQDPTSKPGPYELPFDEWYLHPLVNPGAPGVPEIGKADVNIVMNTGIDGKGLYFTMNNATFEAPSMPVLLQILSGAKHPSQLMPSKSVYTLPPNKVVEISFPHPTNAPHNPHPMHLHGHSFDVIRVAGGSDTNFVNPIRRDVVSIGKMDTDNVTIRFVTDNAGPWFLHCHIDWHLNHGFAVVMAEARNETGLEESIAAPEEWYTLCNMTKPTQGKYTYPVVISVVV